MADPHSLKRALGEFFTRKSCKEVKKKVDVIMANDDLIFKSIREISPVLSALCTWLLGAYEHLAEKDSTE